MVQKVLFVYDGVDFLLLLLFFIVLGLSDDTLKVELFSTYVMIFVMIYGFALRSLREGYENRFFFIAMSKNAMFDHIPYK